jgi:choline dehydrogenase-like flavoprotein
VARYTASPTDISRVRKAIRKLSEMAFAVGAKEVFPSIHGVPDLRSPDDLHLIDNASLDPRDYGIMASHMFGGARMGPDAKTSAVGLDFQVHQTRGIYVLDSSIFPTNLGVNPQHTIMGVARFGATKILETPLPARG